MASFLEDIVSIICAICMVHLIPQDYYFKKCNKRNDNEIENVVYGRYCNKLIYFEFIIHSMTTYQLSSNKCNSIKKKKSCVFNINKIFICNPIIIIYIL